MIDGCYLKQKINDFWDMSKWTIIDPSKWDILRYKNNLFVMRSLLYTRWRLTALSIDNTKYEIQAVQSTVREVSANRQGR